MTGKEKFLLYVIVLVVAFGFSYSTSMDKTLMTFLLTVVAAVLLVAFLIYVWWPIYVFSKSTNMQLVERVLEKCKKVAIFAYNAALVNGDWKEEERWVNRIRDIPKSKRMIMQTAIC